MRDYTQLENDILDYVKNANEILPANLSDLLTNIVQKISFDINDKSASYKGIANTSTNPGTPAGMVFYIATAAGTYINFKNASNVSLVLTAGLNILSYTGAAWENAAFTVDLSTYETTTMVDRRFNYPFHDASNMIIQSDLKAIVKDAFIEGVDTTKTYFIKTFTYHTSGNNFLVEVFCDETNSLVASFSSASWSPTLRYQSITLIGTGVTIVLLLKTDALAGIPNIINFPYYLSQFSPRTFAEFRNIAMAKYPKMNGTQQGDFAFVDGTLQLFDSAGNKSVIPAGNDLAGISSFVGTAESVTITLVGVKDIDIIIACVQGRDITDKDVLTVEAASGSFVVKRLAGGTSNLRFSWIRIAK